MSCYHSHEVTVVPYKKTIGTSPLSGLPVEIPVTKAYLVYEPARNMFHGRGGHMAHVKRDFFVNEFFDEKWKADNAAMRKHLALRRGEQGMWRPDKTVKVRREI